jgi:hypothetical protein
MLDLLRELTMSDPNFGSQNLRTLAAVDPIRFGSIMHVGGSHDALLPRLLDAASRGHSSRAMLVAATEGPGERPPGGRSHGQHDTTSWDNEKGPRQEESQCV